MVWLTAAGSDWQRLSAATPRPRALRGQDLAARGAGRCLRGDTDVFDRILAVRADNSHAADSGARQSSPFSYRARLEFTEN